MEQNGRTAVVFTGQGAQSVGMAKDLYERFPSVRPLFEQANEIVGYDLRRLCFEGPADKLEQTAIQQPAIFLASAAYWQAITETAGETIRMDASAGLSLGEYTALYASGALSFADAQRLVHLRGTLMWESGLKRPGSMVCVVNLEQPRVEELCRRAAGDEVLALANMNCPGQIVISGDKGACARALELCREFDCKGVELPVSGAFHSPLMEDAAEQLRGELQRTTFHAPRNPVYANVTAEPHDGPEQIRDLLYRQMTHPVLWARTIGNLTARGFGQMIEPGPGRVLTGLMRRIERTIKCRNISSADAVTELAPRAEASLEGRER